MLERTQQVSSSNIQQVAADIVVVQRNFRVPREESVIVSFFFICVQLL